MLMKLEDIKAPKGYQIKGFDYPCVGDYILLPSGKEFKIDTHHHAYHCAGIILEEIWEPEIGKYYEFSDYSDYSDPEIHKLKRFNENFISENNSAGTLGFKYIDDKGCEWRYIRPIQGEFGQ